MSSVTQPRNIDRQRRKEHRAALSQSISSRSSPFQSLASTPIASSLPHARRQSMIRLGSPLATDGPLLSKLAKEPSTLSSASIHSSQSHATQVVLIDAENPSFLSDVKDEELILNHNNQYFNSNTDALRSEGGDIVHFINKKSTERRGSQASSVLKKTKSTSNLLDIVEANNRKNSASGINVPGGFRREFLLTKMKKKAKILNDEELAKVPFLTKNFMEFLYIYGHFAGESFDEDFEYDDESGSSEVLDESSSLIPKVTKRYEAKGTTSTLKAFLIMLKSFIGTGIIFLPKGFSNGGLLFSLSMLVIFGFYSYYCYSILISAKITTGVSSFGDIGVKLYGSWMKKMILFSLILTQIGFACAYIIFTSENLFAFFKNITNNSEYVRFEYFFILQGLVFIPLSFIRNVAKLSTPSLVANAFIFIGIFIILSFITSHLITNGISTSVEYYINSKFSLFIGTAIFAFEGIGLIIPIQDSMRHPEQFPKVLGLVLLTITVLMVSVATIGYLSYGSDVKTAILLNLPQSNILVQLIQLFYPAAILLSTPLQLFPAIAIIQNYVFKLNKHNKNDPSRSGKLNPRVKWMKNLLRTLLVIVCINISWFGADDLDKFVSFVGCFACIPLVYIYPPLLHLKSVINGKQLRRQRELEDELGGVISEENLDSPPVDYTGGIEEDENHWKVWVVDGTLVAIGFGSMWYTSYQIMFG